LSFTAAVVAVLHAPAVLASSSGYGEVYMLIWILGPIFLPAILLGIGGGVIPKYGYVVSIALLIGAFAVEVLVLDWFTGVKYRALGNLFFFGAFLHLGTFYLTRFIKNA
jgi:hypothetical protein